MADHEADRQLDMRERGSGKRFVRGGSGNTLFFKTRAKIDFVLV